MLMVSSLEFQHYSRLSLRPNDQPVNPDGRMKTPVLQAYDELGFEEKALGDNLVTQTDALVDSVIEDICNYLRIHTTLHPNMPGLHKYWRYLMTSQKCQQTVDISLSITVLAHQPSATPISQRIPSLRPPTVQLQ